MQLTLFFFSAKARANLVPLLPCHDLLEAGSSNASLDDFGKTQLLCQLLKNSDVCTNALGSSKKLKHKNLPHS